MPTVRASPPRPAIRIPDEGNTCRPIAPAPRANRLLLSKVPEVTVYFWIIKVLCTTVGETAADFLNVNLNFGPDRHLTRDGRRCWRSSSLRSSRATGTSRAVYWFTVTLVSVFGTLVTDNLTDNLGVPLEASTLVFGALLAVTFVAWYRAERTLSIHSILTRRREAFYWLAILFTFALGTAAGDLMAERLGLGYLLCTGLIVAALIPITAVGWKLGLNSVLAFWIIYILTRPLAPRSATTCPNPPRDGGLGLGATLTSLIFVGGIIGIVRVPLGDQGRRPATGSTTGRPVDAPRPRPRPHRGGLRQTAPS